MKIKELTIRKPTFSFEKASSEVSTSCPACIVCPRRSVFDVKKHLRHMDFSHVLQYNVAASSGCSSHIRLCLLTLVCSSIVLSSATFLGRLLIPWRNWYTRRHSGQRRKLPSVMSISAHERQTVCPHPGSSSGVLNTSKHTGHSIAESSLYPLWSHLQKKTGV